MATRLTSNITVDSGTHIWNLASMGLALGGGNLVTTTVPIGSTPNVSGLGAVVKWDQQKAQQFFAALHDDKAVPANLSPNSDQPFIERPSRNSGMVVAFRDGGVRAGVRKWRRRR